MARNSPQALLPANPGDFFPDSLELPSQLYYILYMVVIK